MRSDLNIKRDVETELHANPDIDATDVAVAVKNGVVTLTDFVRSYMQKWKAEMTANSIFYLLRIGWPVKFSAKSNVRIGQRCSSAAYEPIFRGSYPLS